ERRFTLDGHLLGSIGEVCAVHQRSGRRVQIKLTQGRRVGLRAEPEHLLVLQLVDGGVTEEVYNGPGRIVWDDCGKRQSNGQRSIGVTKLRRLMARVPSELRLPRVRGDEPLVAIG